MASAFDASCVCVCLAQRSCSALTAWLNYDSSDSFVDTNANAEGEVRAMRVPSLCACDILTSAPAPRSGFARVVQAIISSYVTRSLLCQA